MSKYLAYAALALALAATPVQAENWTMVTDLDAGGRLLADRDSVRASWVSNTWVVAGTFIILGSDGFKPDTKIDGFIPRDQCLKNHNGKLVISTSDSKDTFTYFWDEQGSKLYDSMGQYLCGRIFGIEGFDVKKFYDPVPPMPESAKPPKTNSTEEPDDPKTKKDI